MLEGSPREIDSDVWSGSWTSHTFTCKQSRQTAKVWFEVVCILLRWFVEFVYLF